MVKKIKRTNSIEKTIREGQQWLNRGKKKTPTHKKKIHKKQKLTQKTLPKKKDKILKKQKPQIKIVQKQTKPTKLSKINQQKQTIEEILNGGGIRIFTKSKTIHQKVKISSFQKTKSIDNIKHVAGILDVVFCCDTTGSMDCYLERSNQAIKTIMKQIYSKVKPQEINVKFGFVAYRDHPPQEYTYVINSHDLDDMETIIQFIKNLNAQGGGDGAQAVLDGLYQASKNMSWRNSKTIPTLRYIFHIADAVPHGKQYGGLSYNWDQGCPYSPNIEKVAHILNIKQIHYRLIRIGELKNMRDIFKNKFMNYDDIPIEKAQQLDIIMSDMIIRQLVPVDDI